MLININKEDLDEIIDRIKKTKTHINSLLNGNNILCDPSAIKKWKDDLDRLSKLEHNLNIELKKQYSHFLMFHVKRWFYMTRNRIFNKLNRKRFSSLKGRPTRMTNDEIDTQIKSVRDEWQRDID